MPKVSERCVNLICLLVVVLFASCSRTAEVPSATETQQEDPPPEFHVVVISGFDSDPTPAQIEGGAWPGMGNSGMFQLMGDLKSKGVDCSFYNWNGTDAGHIKDKEAPGAKRIVSDMLSRAASKPNTKFIMVGHSWGGHTLFEVAGELSASSLVNVEIVHAAVIDASSLMRGERKKLPTNVASLDNYFTANMFCWGVWKDESRVNNIELGDPQNGFMVDGQPNYASSFDTSAHTHAEWDAKLHAEICDNILNIVNQSSSSSKVEKSSSAK